jgi:hypothetical protein
MIFIPIHDSFAKESAIPDWLFNVYNFWLEKKISDTELISAIKFLDEKNIITLAMPKGYDYKSNFLISILQQEFSQTRQNSCQEDWYITGYFLPIETEFHDDSEQIQVEGQTREFKMDFVNSIKSEGWGRTNDGDYLGWYGNEFHLSEFPLDYFGNELVVGTIAVDPKFIEFDTKILIPSLVEPWNEIILIAADVGPSINEKHIDVYTGEGKEAEKETMRITGYNNSICFIE